MAAINYNFIIEQGSDFEINFQYSDQNNKPINLSDINATCCVLQMIPNSGVSATTSFSTKDQANNYSLTSSDQGLISLKLNYALTQLYAFDNAVYDLDVIQGDKIIRLASGLITIQKRQTPFPTCILQQTISNGTENTGNSSGGSPNPVVPIPDAEDLCLQTDCLDLDIYSIPYTGSSISINDMADASGSIVITNTRKIENVELVVNNLNYNYPQDLQMFLCPPSGNKILLAANHKMPLNSGNFNFMFSNKALPTSYLHNVPNGGLCNIYNKTDIIKYSNETLLSSFDHLFGHSVTGVWTLLVRDTDPLASGSIGGWKLVLTYEPEPQ